jgi:histidinol dehydrogenase
VFALGGAGAIAALAYGTASVPAVQRIVGPGNAWVAEAKRQVAGHVGIDSPAGPSELLVLADETADPARVARELVAQAEHDPDAAALAVAIGEGVAARLGAALRAAAGVADRGEIVAASLAARGGVLTAASREQALEFADRYAAEHLLLALAGSDDALAQVRNTGAVFVGEASSVAFGDYLAGGNHVLPTGGHARAASGLSTLDFVRWTAWQRVTPAGAAALAGDCALLAGAERLPGHAAAARAWAEVAR